METASSDKMETASPIPPNKEVILPTIILGTLGHVSHGKSTLVEKITGIKPQRHSTEKIRNITIKLGYANFDLCTCSGVYGRCGCKQSKITKRFSFVDCPGHECLMTVMLNGAAVMDAALFIIAANQSVPQPQTREHLAAAEMMNLKNIIVCQTKIDLVNKEQAEQNYQDIKKFLKNTIAENAPIIPISSIGKINNIDTLLKLLSILPNPKKDISAPPLFRILRSFDINKPGIDYSLLKGGVIGGTLIRGKINIGDGLKLFPGVNGVPIVTSVTSLQSEKEKLNMALPGGLIAVGTRLDPCITKADKLVGQILVGEDEDVKLVDKMTFTAHIMRRTEGLQDKTKIKLSLNDTLSIHLGTSSVQCRVESFDTSTKMMTVKLGKPCCILGIDKVSLSKKIDKSHRLIGMGLMNTYAPSSPSSPESILECDTSYEQLLSRLFNKVNIRKQLKLKAPKVGFVDKKTIWFNFGTMCSTINRSPDHLHLYFLSELSMDGSINSDNQFIIRGKVSSNSIEKLLKRYLQDYVKCSTCRCYDTKIIKDFRTCFVKCLVCEKEKPVDSIKPIKTKAIST